MGILAIGNSLCLVKFVTAIMCFLIYQWRKRSDRKYSCLMNTVFWIHYLTLSQCSHCFFLQFWGYFIFVFNSGTSSAFLESHSLRAQQLSVVVTKSHSIRAEILHFETNSSVIFQAIQPSQWQHISVPPTSSHPDYKDI